MGGLHWGNIIELRSEIRALSFIYQSTSTSTRVAETTKHWCHIYCIYWLDACVWYVWRVCMFMRACTTQWQAYRSHKWHTWMSINTATNLVMATTTRYPFTVGQRSTADSAQLQSWSQEEMATEAEPTLKLLYIDTRLHDLGDARRDSCLTASQFMSSMFCVHSHCSLSHQGLNTRSHLYS